MSDQTAANKAAFVRLQEAGNSGDVELAHRTMDQLIDPNVVISMPLPVEGTGVQALKDVLALLHRAYPDLHITVEDMIAEGDKVVGRNTVTGTHKGEFMGRPPTGRPVRYNEILIARFANGRLVEMWGVVDVLAQMRQLGMIPGVG